MRFTLPPAVLAVRTRVELANLLFAIELDRAAGADVISVAAHPGLRDTAWLRNSPRRRGGAWLAAAAGHDGRGDGGATGSALTAAA